MSKSILLSIHLILIIQFNVFAQEEGLILSYNFDGNTIDQSINSNDGFAVNAVLASDFLGNAESAYLFNGIDSYISAGNSDNLRVSNELTIFAQIQALGDGSVSAGGIIVNKEGEYSLARFADGSLRYALAFDDKWTVHVNTGIFIPLNEKLNIVFIYSQSLGEIQIYVDCELRYIEQDSRIIGDQFPQFNDLRIGGRQFDIDQFFFGIIDEVRVYNRALSVDEFECLTTSVSSNNAPENLSVFPNPTQDIVNFENHENNIYRIDIVDATGRFIKSVQSGNTINKVSLGDFTSGFYILNAFGINNDLLFSTKVIKQQ